MDLIQEANLALWECTSGYHEGDYRKLSEEQIRRALEKAVFTQAKNEGVGLKIAEYLQSYKNTSSILRKKLGRDASQEEYAVEMSITTLKTNWQWKILHTIKFANAFLNYCLMWTNWMPEYLYSVMALKVRHHYLSMKLH